MHACSAFDWSKSDRIHQVGLLGGIQRSSVSLVVIIVEGTGKVDYLLPIIFTTVCAKWVGDKLNDGIYHTLHVVKGIPFLENEPSKRLQQLTAQDLMHSDPVCLQTVGATHDLTSNAMAAWILVESV